MPFILLPPSRLLFLSLIRNTHAAGFKASCSFFRTRFTRSSCRRMSSSAMLQEYMSGWSTLIKTPGLEARAVFDAVWPVTECVPMWSEVAIDCSRVASVTFGPTGLRFFVSSMSENWLPSTSHAFMFSSRFSQNSCRGFSCLPCFNSVFTSLAWFLWIVTGCLKMDAVCRMGGTRDTSARIPPRLRKGESDE